MLRLGPRSWHAVARAGGRTVVLLASTLGNTVAQGRSLVNHLALIAAALIVLSIGGTLAAALAYRSLVRRIQS